jgi:hypothetical protein
VGVVRVTVVVVGVWTVGLITGIIIVVVGGGILGWLTGTWGGNGHPGETTAPTFTTSPLPPSGDNVKRSPKLLTKATPHSGNVSPATR